MVAEDIAPALAVPACDPAIPYIFRHAATGQEVRLTRCTRNAAGTALVLTTPQVSSTLVKLVQRRLAELGLGGGTPDGKLGSRTTKALRQFQARHGLKVDGTITFAVLDRLQERE